MKVVVTNPQHYETERDTVIFTRYADFNADGTLMLSNARLIDYDSYDSAIETLIANKAQIGNGHISIPTEHVYLYDAAYE